jgi:hypothetical protein
MAPLTQMVVRCKSTDRVARQSAAAQWAAATAADIPTCSGRDVVECIDALPTLMLLLMEPGCRLYAATVLCHVAASELAAVDAAGGDTAALNALIACPDNDVATLAAVTQLCAHMLCDSTADVSPSTDMSDEEHGSDDEEHSSDGDSDRSGVAKASIEVVSAVSRLSELLLHSNRTVVHHAISALNNSLAGGEHNFNYFFSVIVGTANIGANIVELLHKQPNTDIVSKVLSFFANVARAGDVAFDTVAEWGFAPAVCDILQGSDASMKSIALSSLTTTLSNSFDGPAHIFVTQGVLPLALDLLAARDADVANNALVFVGALSSAGPPKMVTSLASLGVPEAVLAQMARLVVADVTMDHVGILSMFLPARGAAAKSSTLPALTADTVRVLNGIITANGNDDVYGMAVDLLADLTPKVKVAKRARTKRDRER